MRELTSTQYGALVQQLERELLWSPPFVEGNWLSRLRKLPADPGSLAGFLGWWDDDDEDEQQTLTIDNGVAIINIAGPILHRDLGISWLKLSSHERVCADLEAAQAHRDVDEVVFRWDSYGGTASGCPEWAAFIASFRGKKPMTSIVDAACYSAAYYGASATDRIVILGSGGAGSIGSIAEMVSYAAMNERLGIEVAVATSGSKKALFHPDLPISDEARAALKKIVDESATQFINDVATYRRLPAATVRGFEAGTFKGDEAVRNGLADEVGTFHGTMAAIKGRLRTRQKGNATMSGAVNTTGTSGVVDLDAERTRLRGEIETEQKTAQKNHAAAIQKLCLEHEVPAEHALKLIADGVSLEEARVEIERVADVRAVCKLGGLDAAETAALVAKGKTVRESGAEVQRMLAARQESGSGVNTTVHTQEGGRDADVKLNTPHEAAEKLRLRQMAARAH